MEKLAKYAQVKNFIKENYRHFNAASVADAAEAYVQELQSGNKMFITLAGAMSTAELGITLAEMIRHGKVHAISCTGANMEEDVFNLVAHNEYVRIKDWRSLTAKDETELAKRGLNRVTDTCIPEEEAMRKIERPMIDLWRKAELNKERKFPYQFFYELLELDSVQNYYQIDPSNSWMLAAKEKNLPIFTPGYEDSTMGNMYISNIIKGKINDITSIKSGFEQMEFLTRWYRENTKECSIGFFQIGGGIAGDFPICVVPLLAQDLKEQDVRRWSYFCQIGDSTTSYGSYSGAYPNEKITWGKLKMETPKFIIESDATIVAPLIFAYVLAS